MTAEIRPLPASNLAQLPAEAEQGKWLRKLRLDGSDREDKEFLPGHIEILETPAAPLASILIWIVCGVFAAALTWSCIAKLDIHAVAAGRVQPSGRSKVVQPFDNSKVVSVLVQNGQKVRAGDLLIELDSTQANAELRSVSGDLESAEGEIARREAAVLTVRTDARAPQPRFPVDVSRPIRAREMTALTADLGQYYSSREALQAQLSEKDALKLRFINSTAARERLVKVLRERVEMRESLLASQSGSKASVIDAVQQLEEQAANLAYEKGQLLEADAAMQSILRQIEQLTDQFVAQQTQKITEVAQQRDRLREAIVKAKSKLSFTQLTAPIDGTVQQLAVTTVGQVVTTGQPLLVLVPAQETVEVEALILNRDIGFIQVGQEAVIKIDSFPYTRYGTIRGKVVRISRDAIDDRDANSTADVTNLVRRQSSSQVSATPSTQNLVFPVTVEVDQPYMMVDGNKVALTSGMMATVEIRTGDRSVIDYVLSPLREVQSTVARER